MIKCALCERFVDPDDLLPKRPGCSYCRGYAREQDLVTMLACYERAWIVFALVKQNGVKNRAAKMLGIGRTTLLEKMKRLGIHAVTREGDAGQTCFRIDGFEGFV